MSSLTELIAADPAIAAEVKAIQVEASKAGAAVVEARVASALPILGSDAYPKQIKALACQLLEGKAEPAALQGALVGFDAMKALTEHTILNLQCWSSIGPMLIISRLWT